MSQPKSTGWTGAEGAGAGDGRKIELIFEQSGVKAVAALQEHFAPRTCKALWGALETDIVDLGLHAQWSGREVALFLPEANRNFDPAEVGMENATAYPLPGDLLWLYFPPGALLNFREAVWNIPIIYGPETFLSSPIGIINGNLWAKIIENFDAFAEECSKVRSEGVKTIRIRRLSA